MLNSWLGKCIDSIENLEKNKLKVLQHKIHISFSNKDWKKCESIQGLDDKRTPDITHLLLRSSVQDNGEYMLWIW